MQSLRRLVDPELLDAVVISHMHPDHVLDLVPLRYLLSLPPAKRKSKLDVYVHPGAPALLRRLASCVPSRQGEHFFDRAMNVCEYDPRVPLQIGDLQIRFVRTHHYIEAYAIRVSDGQRSIAYSADTAPSPAVVDLARDADLFLCEASLGVDGIEGGERGHSNAREAGEMARKANAKHLVLTHYGAEFDQDALRDAALGEFDGPVSVADDGLEFVLP